MSSRALPAPSFSRLQLGLCRNVIIVYVCGSFYDKNMPINQNFSFKEVQHLTIQGGCFEKSSKLENILARPMNIVFGRNGSGKSSIARAIADYVQNKENSDFNIDFETELSEDAKNNVFIFNEEFVNDNVKVKDDGIKAIVMIGQQVDIDNQIEKIREESAEVLQTFKNKNENDTKSFQTYVVYGSNTNFN